MTVLAATQDNSVLAQPGTVAFLIVFGMGVVLFFVFRSMSKHLRKISDAARAEAAEAARAESVDDGGPDGSEPDGYLAGASTIDENDSR